MSRRAPHASVPVENPSRRAGLGALLCLGLGLAAWGSSPQAAPRPARILVLGDSLSAEYGLPRGSGWVALLEKRLSTRAQKVQVINASISGETTSGGVTRLPALLKQHRPTHVVLELGANDALRGLPIRATQGNLSRLARQSREAGAQVVLVGMMLPPNFGKRYAEDFAAIYPQVGKAESAKVVPFFLQGVGDRADARDWFQADGIHPLPKAHPIMLDNVWRALGPLL